MPNTLHRQITIDAAELTARRSYFNITDEDLQRLAALRPFAERHTTDIVEQFYRHILSNPGSRRFFPDDATIHRVKTHQSRYFLELFSGVLDSGYVDNRLHIGTVHERIGLPTQYYLGSYAHYLRLVGERLAGAPEVAEQDRQSALDSLEKLVFFDMSLAMDTYLLARLTDVERHQAAIRELSTPVIRLFRHILLLPLVGAVDTQRAHQIMETVLTRVIEEQARVVIIDIAGVLVVDTRVADHLLQTTAAVRLLGAETILTGIRAEVARTIVHLGVDTSSMHTRNRLAEGIELALGIVGKSIVGTPAEEG